MGALLATLEQTIGGPRAWEGFEPETFRVPSENAVTTVSTTLFHCFQDSQRLFQYTPL
jgi:hypothetical protein